MKKTAIVIDDHEFCREILSEYLKGKGFDVICSDSVSCCYLHQSPELQCPKEFPCTNIFLTDNRMPGIHGLELIARQVGGGCKVPMKTKAIISGSWTQEELDRARVLGCKIFRKPYDLDEVGNWIMQQELSSSLSGADEDIPSGPKNSLSI